MTRLLALCVLLIACAPRPCRTQECLQLQTELQVVDLLQRAGRLRVDAARAEMLRDPADAAQFLGEAKVLEQRAAALGAPVP